jgi:hypothetical protein
MLCGPGQTATRPPGGRASMHSRVIAISSSTEWANSVPASPCAFATSLGGPASPRATTPRSPTAAIASATATVLSASEGA